MPEQGLQEEETLALISRLSNLRQQGDYIFYGT